MAKQIKCKACGSTEFAEIDDLLQCCYCKHKTPKPNKNADLLERANAMRVETKDFDEAAAEYDKIIHQAPDEAEAYWGKVLCRYGIEYVEDLNGKYLPTCHRTINESILNDADYKMAVLKAEKGMSSYYKSEAQIIDNYQKRIKLIASKEEPYDVFISFKAKNNFGASTEDSTLAQDLYYYFTKTLKLKVFFSEITLKNKSGQEFEPIIYAALESAPFMVLVGTKPEYINSTWVKNEWSRYAKMLVEAETQNRPPKYLTCALKGMKPEQLPSVLAKYQAINLEETGSKEKIGRIIDSIISDRRAESTKSKSKRGSFDSDANNKLIIEAENFCQAGYQQLAVRDFSKATMYFENAVSKKYDCALAFWGKLLAARGVSNDDELVAKDSDIKGDTLYSLAIRNASPEEKVRFEMVANRCQENRKRKIELAEAKSRHNREYWDEVYKIEENYAENLKNNRVAFDEEADRLFDEYFGKQMEKRQLKRSYEKVSSLAPLFRTILFLIASVFLLIFSVEFIFLARTEIQNDMSAWNILLIILLPLFCFCALMLFILIHNFFRRKHAILITLVGSVVGAIFLLGVIVESGMIMPNGFIPSLFILGLVLLGIGVLWLAKKIKKKHLKESLEPQIAKCDTDIQNILEDIRKYAVEQMTEINQRYYKQYGEEIETYEPNDIIVKKCFYKKQK